MGELENARVDGAEEDASRSTPEVVGQLSEFLKGVQEIARINQESQEIARANAERQCAELLRADGRSLARLLQCIDKLLVLGRWAPEFLPFRACAFQLAQEARRATQSNDEALVVALARADTELRALTAMNRKGHEHLRSVRKELSGFLQASEPREKGGPTTGGALGDDHVEKGRRDEPDWPERALALIFGKGREWTGQRIAAEVRVSRSALYRNARVRAALDGRKSPSRSIAKRSMGGERR